MRARLLYTLVCIFCLSAFASSKNECAYPLRDSSPCMNAGKGLPSKEISKEVTKETSEEGANVCPSDDEPLVRPGDFSTFQLVKFLYI
ncbi:MAG: hypothetical protein BGO55_05615 [Sphingobacteriales bacterium 50-39]|nr:hypothetical protein [Sphingobacteriales bacterium]OJW56072.1 MAG: hypothetical protein BGO55_05615 [Sphingobacteriales bacterium 50-39]